jgi:hypothetical protein
VRTLQALTGVAIASSCVALPATFAIAGGLLPVLLYLGWQEKALRQPPKELIAVCGLFGLSILWGGNAAYIVTWAFTVLILGSLNIDWRSKEVLAPIVGVLLLGIPISLFMLALGPEAGTAQGQGYAGNASFYAGQLVVVSLLVKWPWNLVLASTVGITRARTALLTLAILLPWKIKLAALGIGLIVSLVLWLGTDWAPYQRLVQSDLGLTGRTELWKDSAQRIGDNWFLGTGAFSLATSKDTNSHNLYGIILEGNGILLGSVIIGLLAWRCKSLPGLAILLMGLSDQFWLTTTQGMYLFAMVLSMETKSKKAIRSWVRRSDRR